MELISFIQFVLMHCSNKSHNNRVIAACTNSRMGCISCSNRSTQAYRYLTEPNINKLYLAKPNSILIKILKDVCPVARIFTRSFVV